MRCIVVGMVLGFCLFSLAYGMDTTYEKALQFAKEYAEEIKAKEEGEQRESGGWKAEIALRSGVATYEETEESINSDWDAFYGEITASLNKEMESLEAGLDLAFGQTLVETETWYVSGLQYQTNDMDFYRINFRSHVGGVPLHFGQYEDLTITPFIGYGFRFINFARTNFNILNIITSREVVTEKYHIHHLDAGIKLKDQLTPRLSISGLCYFGHVVANEADNSSLGKINGGGGHLIDASLNLNYSFAGHWQLFFGGFVELQNLEGGEKGDVIWPDNKLNIYGGKVALCYNF